MCSCCISHHLLLFLAGAAFWEAFVRIEYAIYEALPRTYWGFTVTTTYNLYLIVGALVLSGVLLMFGCSTKSCSCPKSH